MNEPNRAFRELYDQHFQFVWRSLRRLGIPEADATDLTQKVFLTAHIKLAQFEGRARITTWLFAICQRVASDYRRSAAVRRELTAERAHELVAEQPDPASAAEARGRVQLAEAILDKLSEQQRVVFVLFELEEMSGEEIAALLELPIGTVRSRLRLAREAFRREVKRLHAAVAKEAV
jgi:RNA polymerase sigma-70 factor, ECF subfamily